MRANENTSAGTGLPGNTAGNGTFNLSPNAKGPCGFKRSDDGIREDVCLALEENEDIDATDIDVQVADGVVTLQGTACDRRDHRLAEVVAESIWGVTRVRNELLIQSASANVDQAVQKQMDRMEVGKKPEAAA